MVAIAGDWFDPSKPPDEHATRLADNVWATWFTNNGEDESHPHLWHWCDKSKWIKKRRAEGQPEPSDPKVDQPQWQLAGSLAHDLVSKDPLTLHPSVYWPDCCGTHGFVTDGVYVSC